MFNELIRQAIAADADPLAPVGRAAIDAIKANLMAGASKPSEDPALELKRKAISTAAQELIKQPQRQTSFASIAENFRPLDRVETPEAWRKALKEIGIAADSADRLQTCVTELYTADIAKTAATDIRTFMQAIAEELQRQQVEEYDNYCIQIAVLKFLQKTDTSSDSVESEAILKDLHERIAPPFPLAWQLPVPPTVFVGRTEAIARLVAVVPTSDTGAVIFGAGDRAGIGKTALALEVANRLKEFFPDGQVYLDLKGDTSAPLSPAETRARVIRYFRRDASPSENSDLSSREYNAIFRNRRVLLVLDNAAGKEQVSPVSPPPPSKMLVVSRSHFELSSIHSEELDALSEAEACELLRRRAPQVADCDRKIAQLCGYLPLALQLTAGTLNHALSISPQAYAQRLEDHGEVPGQAETSLRLCYDLLAEELQVCWRRLSVFPASFDVIAAATLWDKGAEQAQAILDQLEERSMIACETTTKRYHLHELAWLQANSRLTSEERLASQMRQAGYYLQVLARAEELYMKGSDKELLDALALFDLEQENIQAGHAWASANFEHNETAAQLCSEYADTGAYVLETRLRPVEWLAWLEVVLAAARKLQDRKREGLHLGNLGRFYDGYDPRHASAYYEQQLAIVREMGDRQRECQVLGRLGYASVGAEKKVPKRALEYFKEQLTIARKIGDRRAESIALGNLSWVYSNPGNRQSKRAFACAEQELAIARETGDRKEIGRALHGVVCTFLLFKQAARALEYAEEALRLYRDSGDREGEMEAFENLGAVYTALKDNHAVECYAQQIAIARELGSICEEAWAHGTLGRYHTARGGYKRARAYFDQYNAIHDEMSCKGGRRAPLQHKSPYTRSRW
jgi:tetratricopeptide (TPR) repeat protein